MADPRLLDGLDLRALLLWRVGIDVGRAIVWLTGQMMSIATPLVDLADRLEQKREMK
jgi:hypothetical protein